MRLILILFLVAILGCQSGDNTNSSISSVNDLATVDFTNGENVLLDVRSAKEFAKGHIPQAKNVDIDGVNFDRKIAKFDTSKTYYVYCQAGVRSSKACEKLKEKGFKKVIELKDGYQNYKAN